MLLYQQALAIAKDAHKGQVDKAGWIISSIHSLLQVW